MTEWFVNKEERGFERVTSSMSFRY